MDEQGGHRWLSREQAAGYDPGTLRRGKVLLGGAGAGANNAALTLALSTVGEVLVVDFDEFEDHNATRSPFYPTIQEQAQLGLGKAKIVAYKMNSVARSVPGTNGVKATYLADYVQRLPLATFRLTDVVVNGSDNEWARAFMAEQAFLAGKPFVDAGFRGERIQIGVFVPGNPIKDPCWRCLHPDIVPNARFSCTEYAKRAERQGLVPAVQAAAQAAGAIQAEHAILALHGEFPLRNSVFRLNVRTGEAMKYAVARDPLCPSSWHRIGGLPLLPLECNDDTTWQEVLDGIGVSVGPDIRLKPLVDLVWNMPCNVCKQPMAVRSSTWLYNSAPSCTLCGGPFPTMTGDEAILATAEYYPFVDKTRRDILPRRLSAFSMYAGDLLIAEKIGVGTRYLVRLDGDLEQVASRFSVGTESPEEPTPSTMTEFIRAMSNGSETAVAV